MAIFLLLSTGLVVHVVFLLSIFDIYFKSTVLKSVQAVNNSIPPPGKRVVLISVDGLRLDSIFDRDPLSGEYIAGYIHDVMNRRGRWGLSQTRVPTESRPGHVAMLAGFYEDPSAVTRGWKENPVDFDSLFNRSRCCFAWGSPDILNVFFKGLQRDCAFMESYSNEQKFEGDTRVYDNWVYEKFQEFILNSSNFQVSIQEKGLFFFLHLLGQDTSGHTHKPHSKNYRENLKNVDGLLKKIDNLIYGFFRDNETTFVVTSDHGMTNWGSHGAGDPDETDTPIILWGAGIQKPSPSAVPINISQIDIAPLLAILLGASIPVNSVGTLPTAFLSMPMKQIAEAAELNMRQMVEQFIRAQEENQKYVMSFLRWSFNKFSPEEIQIKFNSIKKAIDSRKFSQAIRECKDVIQTCLQGIDYYQNYYQNCLLFCVSLGYAGWIIYLILGLGLENKDALPKEPLGNGTRATFAFVALLTSFYITVQKLPFTFYCYALLPQFLWYQVLKTEKKKFRNVRKWNFVTSGKRALGISLMVIFAVEILVLSFFKRWLFCISMAIGVSWSSAISPIRTFTSTKVLWLASGITLGIFLVMPTIGTSPSPLKVAASGVALCFLSIVVDADTCSPFRFLCSLIRFSCLAASVWNSYHVHYYFNLSHSVSEFSHRLSWLLLVSSFCFLFEKNANVFQKFARVFVCLSIPFVLLSIAHEVFFFGVLFVHLSCWIIVESSIEFEHSTVSYLRIAYLFLTYIFVSFFGLGNISSLNSFDPAWVRCFITVFSPFFMAFLILFKTVIPFFMVTCTMRTINVLLNVNLKKLFLTILIFCNVMALNFLFLIKNKGSWLDIGVSISHYVIQQITIVFIMILFGFTKILMPCSENTNGAPKSSNLCEELKYLPLFHGKSKSKVHKY